MLIRLTHHRKGREMKNKTKTSRQLSMEIAALHRLAASVKDDPLAQASIAGQISALTWAQGTTAEPASGTFSPTLGNYRQILGMTNSSAGGTDFVRYAVNSTIIAVGTAIPSLLLRTLDAYGITRCRGHLGR